MARIHKAEGSERYTMNWQEPYRELEPPEREIAVVDEALATLVNAGILPSAQYDAAAMLAHRAGVRENFEVPWTAITPRMQRLLYAVNAIARPRIMVAVGIFCGFTFISNAGAAIGPGACYKARRLIGIEIKPEEADRARRNVVSIDAGKQAEIVAADGIAWLRDFDEGPIDLLYLDADGSLSNGKAIYLDILKAARHVLRPGSLVLAHNSINAARELAGYLEYVRCPANFRDSVNVMIDDQGLEVSLL